ncbi:RrF2 family transcriptional regulator [Gilvimarinus polysaccharolyticus]|uniref:RrF2 family transcriptional regulator n=1 Tax=Gilvimarinus polysaccharolyticus TaxID=863921 RepID=UPI00067311B8|nr:Rrf2 family transcriptional regulator [Gilvimarinus polysaccharolyticus]
MKVTRYTDYALRVLMCLAVCEKRVTIAEIATSYGISKNHLMKVVQQLNHLGYIDAARGKNGGLQLGRPPNQINLGALIRDTEQDLALVECFNSDTDTCTLTPACQLKGIFAEALAAFIAVFDNYTLADLTPKTKHQSQLLRLLNL